MGIIFKSAKEKRTFFHTFRYLINNFLFKHLHAIFAKNIRYERNRTSQILFG